MYVEIDIEKLRKDLRDDSYGAYFGGGIGPAILEAFQADRASPEELIDMARRRGFDLNRYIVRENNGASQKIHTTL